MDKYTITKTEKKQTERGANYYDIWAVNNLTGVIETCVYFGNTKPKRLLEIQQKGSGEKVYYIGIIQPHTSRDKKTGRFIKNPRQMTA